MIIHVVKEGETPFSIASKYGTDTTLLLRDNGLTPYTSLAVGQAIVITEPEIIHTVKDGETLYSIAASYGLSVIELLRNNYYLMGNETVYPGQQLVISFYGGAKPQVNINAYAYTFISNNLLKSTLPYLSFLTPFTYGISEGGGIIDLNDEIMINLANNYGVKPLMHLSTLNEQGVFSNETASMIFENPAAADNLIYQTTRNIQNKGYYGLDIDFEYINPQESFDYAALIKRFAEALNPLGYNVTAALAPKTSDSQQGQLYEGHNYALIGANANYVLLMTYEWGYTYGPPLAVAPINNVRRVLDYAVTRILPEKIYLGVPTYGYDWTLPYIKGVSKAPSISNITAVNLAVQFGAEILFDEISQSPWFRYTDYEGREHEVWFEDARSIQAKLSLITEYGLSGAGYWDLMRPFPQNWLVLNSMFDINNY